MEYFLLKSCVTVPLHLVINDPKAYQYRLTKENFDHIPDPTIVYYHQKPEEEIPDIMVRPTFMMSDLLRKIIHAYDPTVGWKDMFLLPDREDQFVEKSMHYSIPDLHRQKCLHKDTVIQPNGAVERLILDKDRLRNVDIFQVEETQENCVIVSLALAESISRRHPYGVKLLSVEVR